MVSPKEIDQILGVSVLMLPPAVIVDKDADLKLALQSVLFAAVGTT